MKKAKQSGQRKTNPFLYAFGMFGTSIPINMFKTFATVFYVDQLSVITFSQFGIITAAYTFLDAIDNPIYGFLSDRTRTRYGRRRPWLVIATPLLVICYILFFNPPASIAAGSPFSYVMLMYMLTGTLDSMISTNYGALFPELFRDEKERAKTNAMRQIFQLTAMVVSIALTPVVAEKLGFGNTAIVYGILAIVVIWFMAFSAKEDLSLMDQPKPPFLGSIKAVLTNPKFWKYGMTNCCFGAALALVQAGVPFYVKYYLGREDGLSATILLGAAIGSAIIFIPVWIKIIGKLSVMRAWRLAFGLIAFLVLPLYFTSSLATAVPLLVVLGFATGGVQATMDLVSARILDEDTQKYGLRREGIYSSLLGVMNKLYGLFVSAGYFIVDKLYGFVDGNEPGPRPDDASRFLMVLFPALLLFVGFLFSFWLKFKDDGSKQPAEKETVATEQKEAEEE